MASRGRDLLLVALPLWMSFGTAGNERIRRLLPILNLGYNSAQIIAASLREPEICFILDGILFLYGIVLTALYCRIKIYNAREENLKTGRQQQGAEEGIYTGLTPHAQDTYETIGMKK